MTQQDPRGEPGLRYDADKPRMDLIPPEFMEALGQHYAIGAAKYEDRNWEKGMSWGRCFASMMRHAWAWMRGEDHDPETGSHHMIAVAWNAIAIYTYHVRKVGKDDRGNRPCAACPICGANWEGQLLQSTPDLKSVKCPECQMWSPRP